SEASDIFRLGVVIKRIVIGTMDYSSIADMDDRECVEHVHKTWRRRLQEIRRYPSFEADCQQVRTCIEIAVACTKRDPRERPLMKDIIRELYEVETRGNYTSSQIEQGIHDYEVRKFSLKELEHITGNFSEKLGQDGFSAVYKGKFEYGEVIAVKRFDKRLRKPEQQFEKVVNIVKLEHKNIVRLTGYCYEPTKVPVLNDKNPDMYILQDVIENLLCYDFFPNGSLERILDDKSCELDWQTRHKIIRGICEGLHHLHVGCQDAPIVHEGIKPTNILLDDGMVPKLGDFCTSMAVTP
uniref:Protein kinase domain-containing protein n=1 Tax=Aegilops tauschii subsp. strangulata TaxID=200361 RepID=A0A453MFS2_AEGTS